MPFFNLEMIFLNISRALTIEKATAAILIKSAQRHSWSGPTVDTKLSTEAKLYHYFGYKGEIREIDGYLAEIPDDINWPSGHDDALSVRLEAEVRP